MAFVEVLLRDGKQDFIIEALLVLLLFSSLHTTHI